jgi:hypothetical protein
MKNLQSTEFLTEAQKRNPVHMAMLGLVDASMSSMDNSWKNHFTALACSKMYNNTIGRNIDVRGADGASVFEQSIDFTIIMRNLVLKAGHPVNVRDCAPFFSKLHTAVVNYNVRSAKNEKGTIDQLEELSNIAMMVPTPYDDCQYSRISNKAVEYLISLGIPRQSLVEAYMEEMNLKAKANPRGVYEEIVYFFLNGSQNIIYVTVRNGFVFMFRRVRNVEKTESYCDISIKPMPHVDYVHGESGKRVVLSTDFSEATSMFDFRSFLVNLWAAKAANSFESVREPDDTRKSFGALTGTTKPDFSTYNYVQITPQGEQEFDEARELMAQARREVSYHKTIWFFPAYYARRGTDKRIVLCRASIHHRRCAEVAAPQKPTMYT